MKTDGIEERQLIDELTTKIGKSHSDTIEQRDAANEDMRFCNVDGGMWENWTINHPDNRAKMEFDITSDFVQRFVDDQNENPASVLFTPDDDEAGDDDADLVNSMYRADFADNDGEAAQSVAIEEVAECGIGHFRFITKYIDESNPENENQDIHFDPIFNSYSTVVWDRQGKRIDKKDAKWCAVLTPYTPDAFDGTYPDATPSSAYTPCSRGMFDWSSGDTIYVAEYYYVEVETLNVSIYRNTEQVQVKAYTKEQLKDIQDELREEGWEYVRDRKLKKRIVKKLVFTNIEMLEKEKKIPGEYIPVIPFYGVRKFIDGKEYYRGLVRKLKDPNRTLNSTVSRVTDASSSSPDEKPIFTEEQIDGYQSDWADTTQGAFRVVNSVTDAQGNPILAGPVGYVKPPAVDPNTAIALDFTSNFVQRATGNAPQDTIDPDASGKAINALLARENKNTGTISANIRRGVKHSGDVWLSMASEVYSGMRSKNVLAVDGNESRVKINKEVYDEEKDAVVVSTPFGGKKYKVRAQVGPQYETDREATVDTLERMLDKVSTVPALEKYADPIVTMWMDNIRGTGIEALKKFNRTEMLKLGLKDPETPEEEQLSEKISQQENPSTKLAEAAAMQQEAEATNLMASAENKQADTQKKKAETVEILEGIGKVAG